MSDRQPPANVENSPWPNAPLGSQLAEDDTAHTSTRRDSRNPYATMDRG